jgi:acyl-CoA thioesterase I
MSSLNYRLSSHILHYATPAKIAFMAVFCYALAMKILYGIAIALLIYVLIILGRFLYILYFADLPKIIQSDEKSIGQGPPLKYMATGDSTAAGEGASTVQQSYTYLIAQHLGQTHTVQYKNTGVRGYQTTDLLDESKLKTIIEYNPDIITISIGANDITHFKSPASTIANIKNILEKLTQQTKAQIYITNIPIVDRVTLLPYPYRKILEYRVKKTNPQISSLESDRVHIVDIHEFGWDQFQDIRSTFAADQFHPNDIGYANWAAAFISRMNQ